MGVRTDCDLMPARCVEPSEAALWATWLEGLKWQV
jgi:hypothetical protein